MEGNKNVVCKRTIGCDRKSKLQTFMGFSEKNVQKTGYNRRG